MRRSGPNASSTGGRKNSASVIAQQNTFRKLRTKLNNPSSTTVNNENSVGKGFQSFKNGNRNATNLFKTPKASSTSLAETAAEATKRIIQKEPNSKEISTAELFDAIVNAPAPGPMSWNGMHDEDEEDEDEFEDEYPTYEDELKIAETNRRNDEKRKFLNELKLASDLEDEKLREEDARSGRRANKGLASTWFFGNGTGAAGVVKGN